MKKAIHGGGGLYRIVGIDFEHLEQGTKVVNADGLDAWFDPSPKAVAKLEKHLAFSIKTSPPVHATGLVEAISKYRNIPKENILVAGGSSDLMFVLFPNLTFKKVLVLDPMYGEYKHIFENVLQSIELDTYNLLSENNFEIETNDFINAIRQKNPDLVTVVNPNSPTGGFINRERILEVLESIPKETILVIDETYVDYVDSNQSVETLVPLHKNLIVIKSMSKAYALSGVRVAYLVANKELIERLDRYTPPFQVSLPAQILAVEALKDTGYYQQKWNETKILRQEFVKELWGIPDSKIYAGQGNFVLIELLNKNLGKAANIVNELAKKNIFIRDANSMGGQFRENFLRIAVKDADSNKKIAFALKELL